MRANPPTLNANTAPLYEMRQQQNGRMAGAVPVYNAGNFGFADLMDVVNPLQHLPLVAPLYRQATGDEISPAADVMGGAVFGGPLGAAASAITRTIADDMALKNQQALALQTEQPNTQNPHLEIILDEAIGTLPGTTLALANLKAPAKREAFAHETRAYNA